MASAPYAGVPGVTTPANSAPVMGQESQPDMTAGPDTGSVELETPGVPGAAQLAGGNLSGKPGMANPAPSLGAAGTPTALKTTPVQTLDKPAGMADKAPQYSGPGRLDL